MPETDYGEESDDLQESNDGQKYDDLHEAIEDGIEVVGEDDKEAVDQDCEEGYMETDCDDDNVEDPDNEDGDLILMPMSGF